MAAAGISARPATPSADDVRAQVEAALRRDRGALGPGAAEAANEETRRLVSKRGTTAKWQKNFLAKYGLAQSKDLFAPLGRR